MNGLGIYFGPKTVGMVETRGKQPITTVQIPRASLSSGDVLQERVPEEIKLSAFIKEEIRKNKIDETDVTVALSGKDLIIRTFEMPILPRQELDAAISFEVKKYIPFKVEELVSDSQYKLDKVTKKNYVLFMGIKKEVLNRYLSIVSQTGLKIAGIEYAAFSMAKLLSLVGINEKNIIAMVNIDLAEEDDVNFVVLDNGFPLFSRDISISSEPARAATSISPAGASEEGQFAVSLEKLKREIRISLDYYDRTFPLKNIKKVFFVMNRDYYLEMENFLRDIGLSAQWVNVEKGIGKPMPFSLSFLKAYSTSLLKTGTPLKINLLSAQEKMVKKPGQEPAFLSSAVSKFKTELITVGACVCVCVATVLIGAYRLAPIQNELQSIIDMRPPVVTVSASASYEELTAMDSAYKLKTKAIDEMVKKQVFLTEVLEVIPRAMPKSIKLLELSYRKSESKIDLLLSGTAYLGDSEKEFDLVNSFLAALKEDPAFSKYFKNISILTIEHSEKQEPALTTFSISCENHASK